MSLHRACCCDGGGDPGDRFDSCPTFFADPPAMFATRQIHIDGVSPCDESFLEIVGPCVSSLTVSIDSLVYEDGAGCSNTLVATGDLDLTLSIQGAGSADVFPFDLTAGANGTSIENCTEIGGGGTAPFIGTEEADGYMGCCVMYAGWEASAVPTVTTDDPNTDIAPFYASDPAELVLPTGLFMIRRPVTIGSDTCFEFHAWRLQVLLHDFANSGTPGTFTSLFDAGIRWVWSSSDWNGGCPPLGGTGDGAWTEVAAPTCGGAAAGVTVS